MDVFSDDVKVKGLIDEIEIAEAKARKAMLERQIKESQPSHFSLKRKTLIEKAKNGVKEFREGLKLLTTKVPADVRVEKVRAEEKYKALEAKTKKTEKVKMPKAPRESIFKKINNLVPNGISYRSVATICLIAAAVVTASELGIWAFTHPAVKTEIPKTGFVIEEDEETTEPVKEEVVEEKAEQEEKTVPATDEQTTTTGSQTTTTKRTTKTVTAKQNNTGKTTVDSNEIYIDSNLSGNETVEQVEDPDKQKEEPAEQPKTDTGTEQKTEESEKEIN